MNDTPPPSHLDESLFPWPNAFNIRPGSPFGKVWRGMEAYRHAAGAKGGAAQAARLAGSRAQKLTLKGSHPAKGLKK